MAQANSILILFFILYLLKNTFGPPAARSGFLFRALNAEQKRRPPLGHVFYFNKIQRFVN
jgi:hypothetical protein